MKKKVQFVHFYLVGKTILEDLKCLNLAVEILGSYLPAAAQHRSVGPEDQRKVQEAWIEFQKIAARQRESELESSLYDGNPRNAPYLCPVGEC